MCDVDLSDLVLGESQNVGKLLPPANLIQERLIADIFTRVTVQPATLRDGIDLGPDVV